MAPLRWSSLALAVTSIQQRERMTELFHAYLRVGSSEGRETLPGSVLYLDLPGEQAMRYRFLARALPNSAWEVDARLIRPDLDICCSLFSYQSSLRK
ncbi:MAG: hypothetical protein H7039_19505 [Bryobacteraceae bacterium]|nr:hypothetical protein [Bryobacteraceae bacterium]